MRLLTLDFENVNSLAGHWRIDFTHRDYRLSPLFAITGNTGSGKSSILDAISLALFGRTPRVTDWKGKTKKTTEAGLLKKDSYDETCPMLTKGANRIRASVRFICRGKIYGSTWSRRIKRTGTLSEAEVELIEFPSESAQEGRLIANAPTTWKENIVSITRLTFSSFTRSMLLAQGAFSNFLSASEDQRAEILEDITGTEIYAAIGARVFERHKAEKDTLSLMQQALDVFLPLSNEEREQLVGTLRCDQASEKKYADLLRSINDALAWRRRLDEAEKNATQVSQLAHEAQCRRKAFEGQNRRAKIARAALPALTAHRRYEEENSKIQHYQQRLDTLRQVISELNLTDPDRLSISQQAAADLKNAETELECFEASDGPYPQMVKLDAEIKSSQRHCRQIAMEDEAIKRLNSKLKSEYQLAKTSLEAAKNQTDDDTALYEAGRSDDIIAERLGSLELLAEAIRKKALCTEELQEELRQETRTQSALVQERDALKFSVQSALNRSEILRQKAEAFKRKVELADSARSPQAALEAVGEITRYKAAAQERMRLLEDKRWVSEQIENARQYWPQEVRNCADPLLNLLTLRLEKRLDENSTFNPGLLFALSKGLQACLKELEAEKEIIIQKTAEVTEWRKKQAAFEAESTSYEQKAREDETNARMAEDKLAKLIATHHSLEKHLHTACADLRLTQNTFLEKLDGFSNNLKQGTPEEIVTRLRARKVAREEFLVQREQHLQVVQQLNSAIEKTSAELTLQTQQVRMSENRLLNAKEALRRLTTLRLERFGQTDPEVEKARLSLQVKDKRQKRDRIAAQIQEDHEKRTQTNTEIRTLSNALEEARLEQNRQLALRGKAMLEKSFTDLDTLLAAELPLDEIERIEENNRLLENEENLCKGQSRQACDIVRQLQKEKLSDDSVEVLLQRFALAETEHNRLLTQVAEKKETLHEDDRKREKTKKQLLEIRRQESLVSEWDILSKLIGSRDGAKFRRAAQKITFRILLDCANRAMKTMTDRYLLVGSGEDGLMVDVVDKDMGGQIRTSKNLSGGETFIVSLALALGLSQMGGDNLRVDTLFLDEGFGTLDEDTLNKALYALENLQQSSGKLIGVISHVPNVRERFANHITVTKHAGSGTSTLSGPGVSV